jgi:hypothetical protein
VIKLTNKDGSEVHLFRNTDDASCVVVLYDDNGIGVNGGFTHVESIELVKAIIKTANIHPEELR